MFTIRNQAASDSSAVNHLLDLSFGFDRQKKSAYGLRRGLTPIADLTLAAEDKGELVGSIQFWPLHLSLTNGTICPPGILLLGPLAVHPDKQSLGIGKALVEEGLARATALGYSGAVLVGDPAYYSKFGFDHGPVAQLLLAAEPDQNRVQGRELAPGALVNLHGEIISAADSNI
jgi:predicted N-acetyltransferase YhbS